jgi:hypothetical protein
MQGGNYCCVLTLNLPIMGGNATSTWVSVETVTEGDLRSRVVCGLIDRQETAMKEANASRLTPNSVAVVNYLSLEPQ